VKLKGGRYRAATQVKVLSPEITIVTEADTIHFVEGRMDKTVKGEVVSRIMPVEERGWQECDGTLSDTSSTLRGGQRLSTKLPSLTLRARENPKRRFTSLVHLFTEDFLRVFSGAEKRQSFRH
jgi:hypothetical protein